MNSSLLWGLLLALLLRTTYSGYEQQKLSHREDVINIDEHGDCVPDVSCKGIEIKEIPYISGKSESSLILTVLLLSVLMICMTYDPVFHSVQSSCNSPIHHRAWEAVRPTSDRRVPERTSCVISR